MEPVSTTMAVVTAITTVHAALKQVWKIQDTVSTVYKAIAGDDGLHMATCVWDKLSLTTLAYDMFKDSLQDNKDLDLGSRTAGYVYQLGGSCGVHAYLRLVTSQAIYAAFGNKVRAAEREKQAAVQRPVWDAYVEARKAELMGSVAVQNSTSVAQWAFLPSYKPPADIQKYTVQHWQSWLTSIGANAQALRVVDPKWQQAIGQVQQQGFVTSGLKALLIYTGQWADFLKALSAGVKYTSMLDAAANAKAAEQAAEMRPEHVTKVIIQWLNARAEDPATKTPRTLAQMIEIAKDADVVLGVRPWSKSIQGIPADAVQAWWADRTTQRSTGGAGAGLAITAAVIYLFSQMR
jgi:hypothetical protein